MTNETAQDDALRQEETVWFAVCVTECIAIFVINAVTIIAFARNHHLRKRTTYLIINLTVADLLVGSVTGPLGLKWFKTDYGPGFSWQKFSILIFYNIFPISSLSNLSLIALERLHATLCPFTHSLIGEWVYFRIIICSWLLALLLSPVMAVLEMYEQVAGWYAWASFMVLALLILTISYVAITVNVKNNPPPHHFAPVPSDRKLSVTLFIVTVVSILTVLPFVIYAVIPDDKISKTTEFHIEYTVFVLYLASSLVNPLIYAIRMKEFRKAVKDLICKRGPE